METVCVCRLIRRTKPDVTNRTDVVTEVRDRVIAVGRLHIRHVTIGEWVGNLCRTYLVADTYARTLIVGKNLCDGGLQGSEGTLASTHTGLLQVVTEGETVGSGVFETGSLHRSQTAGVGTAIPSHLQLESAVLQECTNGLCVGQFLCTCDVFEILVGVFALELSNLAGLSVAEEDELQRMEAEDGGIVEHLFVHAVVEVVKQQCAVERP